MMKKRVAPIGLLVGRGSVNAKYYCTWLCAAAQAHAVRSFEDTFAGNMVLACAVLQNGWQAIVQDLSAGRLSKAVDVDGEIRAAVERQLGGPCPEAARHLADAMAPDPAGFLERLFPNLASVMGIVTGSHAKYVPQLRALAPTVPIISGLYGATEGFIGVCHPVLLEGPWSIEPGKDGEQAFVLFPKCDCYIEFLPVADGGTAHAVVDGNGDGHVGSEDGSNGHAANGNGSNGDEHAGAGSNGHAANGNGSNGHGHASAGSSGTGVGGNGSNSHAANGTGSNGLAKGGAGSTFAAAEEPNASMLVAMDGLQLGRRYQLVLTSLLGLFRYQMGEVVRVVDYYERTPVVAFEGRSRQVSCVLIGASVLG